METWPTSSKIRQNSRSQKCQNLRRWGRTYRRIRTSKRRNTGGLRLSALPGSSSGRKDPIPGHMTAFDPRNNYIQQLEAERETLKNEIKRLRRIVMRANIATGLLIAILALASARRYLA